jgi:filamentous hemagglutinin family protein
MKYSPDYSSRFRILKGGKISLVVSALLGSVTFSFASPSGEVVTSGSATVSQSGKITNINQSTNKASINWQKFNVASDETVNFNQPNVNSITLNRVVGNERSVIDGALNANGQVWILNSNGVLFGKNASINTAGLLATTKELSDQDFQAGNYTFKGSSTESVINLGEIDISNSGYATLLANSVSNEGTIKAVKGSVRLIGANEVTINLNGNSILDLTVNNGVLDALVENKGAIYADGGQVYLTTNAVNELLKGVVNNTGIIEAKSLDDTMGKIVLFAHGGSAKIDGTLDASGGFIETSGKSLHVENNTVIKTKTWLLDPDNITIQSSGGAVGGESVSATAIQNALSTADIELQATNDITVNENITWATDKKLTLTAGDEIYVNATIKNTNTTNGGVYFNANNTTTKVIFDTNGLVSIYNVYQLQWMNQALAGKYELGGNINALGTSSWNGGEGFNPIGNNTTYFTGSFDGLGHTIDSLYINRPTTNHVGLFGRINTGATIKNIGLTNATIRAQHNVGGLVGFNYKGIITDVYVTGNVSGQAQVGGLAGANYGSITNAYATSNVSGTQSIGGLLGLHREGSITNAYATGNVNSTSHDGVGGLVGWIYDGTMTNVYATGNVSGITKVGGLVGWIQSTGSLTYPASITNAYATGNVSGTSKVGGLVGENWQASINNSFWNTTNNGTLPGVGTGTSTGVTGKTTAQMKESDTFSDWDILLDNTLNVNYPTLRMQDSGNVWVIGTKVASTSGGSTQTSNPSSNPTPQTTPLSPSSNPSPTPVLETPKVEEQQQKEIQKVITTIANQNALMITTPKVQTTTTTPNNAGKNVAVNFSAGENQNIISQPIQGQNTQRISLSEARQKQQENGVNSQEVRVSLSRSSMIELVEGGVNLPDGVEQEFYVAQEL